MRIGLRNAAASPARLFGPRNPRCAAGLASTPSAGAARPPADSPESLVSRAYLLRLFRHTLREVNRQFTKPNGSRAWRDELVRQFRGAPASSILVPADAELQTRTSTPRQIAERNAEDLLTFLRSNRTHREMMELYWPLEKMTDAERVEASAKRVGLNLPKMFRDMDED
ncbi:hypothetical protein DFJ74DRAFT_687437 [Hyaloraphidium curvatum]|nr:hypothetical protein DFJ74DRAFT_687437 [Hyaloraphidium curvatum]